MGKKEIYYYGKDLFMRNNKLIFLTLFVLTVVLVSGCTSPSSPLLPGSPGEPQAPGNGKTGTITGTVVDRDSGLKLWSGTVEIAGVGKANIKDGTFTLENVPYGTYTLNISKQFYNTHSLKVVLNKDVVTVDIKMQTSFSSAEVDLLARLVHAEAKGESYKGQVAVAATVLNRVLHRDYPNTLSGVINQVIVANGKRYYQYEPVLNGTIKQPAGQNAIAAVQDALAGWDPSLGATGFFAPAKVGSSSWVRTRPVTVNIGNHRFFK